jgi:polyphosphate kinase
MADVNRMFNFLEQPKTGINFLRECKVLIPCPYNVKREMLKLIDEEIKSARKKKPAAITLKMNSLSDEEMIQKLYDAARAGVQLKLIIRGIFCMFSENKKYEKPVRAISIVDEYLEHARVWVFHNRGKEKVYISSADWMLRNLEHRVEATCPIWNGELQQELKDMLNIQLQDNVKARWLDNQLSNEYVRTTKKKIRSQVETYNYLYKKTQTQRETGRN